jgi:agmatine/peptidylarginine deiminase
MVLLFWTCGEVTHHGEGNIMTEEECLLHSPEMKKEKGIFWNHKSL